MKRPRHYLKSVLVVSAIFLSAAMAYAVSLFFYITPLQSPRPDSSGGFGFAVSGAGDLNNDGYADIIIGAPFENNNWTGSNGGAYTFSGKTGALLDTLDSPLPENLSLYGGTVAAAGDLNNDGYDDVMVAAHWQSNSGSSGAVYIFSGSSGDTLFVLRSPASEGGGYFGTAISQAGDLNNDGSAEIIVGAPEEWPGGVNRAGRAYVFSGATGDLLFTLEPAFPEADGNFGAAVASAGDLNSDGIDDLIIGAHGELAGGEHGAGRVYVFSGATTDLLFTVDAFTPQNGGKFGYTIAAAGDLNSDGTNEFVVGAISENFAGLNWTGRAYVINGAGGDTLHQLNSSFPKQWGEFGATTASGGDIDGDGVNDILVGALREDVGGVLTAGRLYVFSGASGDTLGTVTAANPVNGHDFGMSITIAGDVNNDGLSDILIGASSEDVDGISTAGKAYLYSSGPLTGIDAARRQLPAQFELYQNFPNPFNPATVISYSLTANSRVRLDIHDISGQKIKTAFNGQRSAGSYDYTWEGVNNAGEPVVSGVYFYRLAIQPAMGQATKMQGSRNNILQQTKKMILIR